MKGQRLPAQVRGNAPSRTLKDLRQQDAATLVAAVGVDLAEAVRVTAGWDGRRLRDVALTLALAQYPRGKCVKGWPHPAHKWLAQVTTHCPGRAS